MSCEFKENQRIQETALGAIELVGPTQYRERLRKPLKVLESKGYNPGVLIEPLIETLMLRALESSY